MSFVPPLLNLTAGARGVWLDGRTLEVVFEGVPESTAALPGVAVGALNVSVRASGGLLSANNQSSPSNASALVTGGSWGDEPVVLLTAKSSTALRVLLGPPSYPVPYDVHRFVLQWSTTPVFDDDDVPQQWADVMNHR